MKGHKGGPFNIRRFYEDAMFDRNGVEITVPNDKYKIKKRIWECETQIEMWEKTDDWENALYLTGKFGLDSRLIHPKMNIEIFVTEPILDCSIQITSVEKAKTFADMLEVLTLQLEKEKQVIEEKLEKEIKSN